MGGNWDKSIPIPPISSYIELLNSRHFNDILRTLNL